jgi:hypothetical protein
MALAHRRRRLQRHHISRATGQGQGLATQTNCATGDQGKDITHMAPAGQAGRQVSNDGSGRPLTVSTQETCTNFDNAALLGRTGVVHQEGLVLPNQRAMRNSRFWTWLWRQG